MSGQPSKPGMTQQTRAGEKSPSLPTPNTSFILWCQAPDYPHALPVNSSPYKRVRNKVYCKAIITWSSLADLCADHRINSNWLWSPAWGHSEILHSLAESLQIQCLQGIWDFPSFLPPYLPFSLSPFFSSWVNLFTQLFIVIQNFNYSFINHLHSFTYSGLAITFFYNLYSFIKAYIDPLISLTQTRHYKGYYENYLLLKKSLNFSKHHFPTERGQVGDLERRKTSKSVRTKDLFQFYNFFS